MREFFKGWRRKAGCVLLAMACALMGAWFRSSRRVDWIELQSPISNCVFVSGGGRFLFLFGRESINGISTSPESVRLKVTPTQGRSRNRISVEWDSYGASAVHVWPGSAPVQQLDSSAPDERTMLHYLVAVLPLTLLSAYLILWKPRKRTGAEHA